MNRVELWVSIVSVHILCQMAMLYIIYLQNVKCNL